MSDIIPVKVGVVGCGNVSGIYLQNAQWLKILEVKAVADLRRDVAEAKAAEFEIPRVYTVDEMLADPEIEIILNITTPEAHAKIALAALGADKSVYNEKPLALSREEGRQILDLAQENGLRVGCAPDTFMGAGHQTCRKLIADGASGRPVAATAFMMGWGMETWHPNPEFFFKPGGGPMFDVGPYYLTDLISMLGPVTQVTGMNVTGRQQRTITSQPLAGQIIDVEIPTHVTGLMAFESGAMATIITSFDVPGSRLPQIEIYGTEGTLNVPDPNIFGGEVWFKAPGHGDWEVIPHSHGYAENSRGLGLADMAYALRTGRDHRANGELAYHVLDLMHGFHDAAEQERYVSIESRCEQPRPMPQSIKEGVLDN